MRHLTLILLSLLLGIGCAMAQTKEVSGKVISAEDNQPLIGAYVVVKGNTAIGQATDENGFFHFNVPTDVTTLVATYVGMNDKEFQVGTNLTIIMEAKSETLSEVVVTALGITRSKKALGYAVQELKGDDLSKVRTGNVVKSLSGRVAGVQIRTASGQLGGGAKINIRGNSSITGNNQPLFVIDGVPISNNDYSYGATGGGGYDLGNLAGDVSADDVENMSILRGAQATALYGSRAANGVVMITTKKAKREKGFGVSVNSSFTFDQATHIPIYQKLYGGGQIISDEDGGMDGFEVAVINGKKYRVANFAEDCSWGPRFDPNLKVLHWNAFDEWDKANYLVEKPWVYPKNDYTSFFEIGHNIQNNIAIQKVTDASTLRISFTNSTATGITPNSHLTKNNINFNGTTRLNKYFDVWATINYAQNIGKGRPQTGYGEKNPSMKMWQWIHTNIDYAELKDYINPDGSQRPWNRISWNNAKPAYADNPYWMVYKNYQSDRRNRVFGNTGINIIPFEWLKITGRIGGDYFNMVMEERSAIGSQSLSEYYLDNREMENMNYELFASAQKRFMDDKFGLSSIVGLSRSDFKTWRRGGVTSDGLVLPEIYNLTNSKAKANAYDYKSQKRINSVYGNLNLDYGQVIYLDLTARNDWSSTLPENNRSYFYPSIGLSVVLTGIETIRNVSWINFLKIRGSWAKVGNDTDPYNLASYYIASNNGAFSGNPRYQPNTSKSNAKLKPESTESYEFGIEGRLFNSRVGFDISYFSKRTFDQIMPLSVPGTTGYARKYINAGQLSSSGIECNLNLTPIKMKDFEWNVNFNFATLRNVVDELDGENEYLQFGRIFRAKVGAYKGQSYPIIYGTDYATDENGKRLINPRTGLYVPTQIKPIGNVTPNLTMGLSNSFRFKGFDLNILFDMQRGGHMYYLSHAWGMYSGILKESAEVNGVDIRKNGIILDGVFGKLVKDKNNNTQVVYLDKNGKTSDAPIQADKKISAMRYGHGFYDTVDAQNVFSTDYIKLREISIGYTLPNRLTGPLKGVRFSAFGRNLATFGQATKHFDPEYLQVAGSNAQGIEGGYVPTTKSYGFSINFNF